MERWAAAVVANRTLDPGCQAGAKAGARRFAMVQSPRGSKTGSCPLWERSASLLSVGKTAFSTCCAASAGQPLCDAAREDGGLLSCGC